MPKNPRSWKIATAQAQRMGYKSFKKGTPGDKKRKQIAEGIGERPGKQKPRVNARKLIR